MPPELEFELLPIDKMRMSDVLIFTYRVYYFCFQNFSIQSIFRNINRFFKFTLTFNICVIFIDSTESDFCKYYECQSCSVLYITNHAIYCILLDLKNELNKVNCIALNLVFSFKSELNNHPNIVVLRRECFVVFYSIKVQLWSWAFWSNFGYGAWFSVRLSR